MDILTQQHSPLPAHCTFPMFNKQQDLALFQILLDYQNGSVQYFLTKHMIPLASCRLDFVIFPTSTYILHDFPFRVWVVTSINAREATLLSEQCADCSLDFQMRGSCDLFSVVDIFDRQWPGAIQGAHNLCSSYYHIGSSNIPIRRTVFQGSL